MMKRYFGTDGIRGRTGTHPITPGFALQLGWAVGQVLRDRFGYAAVLISKDTRLSGYLFESALEAGLLAAGVEVYQLGPMPTPALAYLTRSLRAQAGVMISASHNAYQDNGFKFFTADGSKFSDAWEYQVEQKLAEPLTVVAPQAIAKAHRLTDVHGRYIEFCKSTFGGCEDLRGLKIVLDCAHGATYQVAPTLFRELGAEVQVIGDKPNGVNINDGCGSTDPAQLRLEVLAMGADLGIGFDGDGDRVIMVDHLGNVIDGDQLLYILALEYQAQGRLHGGVVGTLMSNLGLERALHARDLGFVRAQVGDRHIIACLREQRWYLGGESSGHLICLDKTTTGDGLIGALQVLQAVCRQGVPLATLAAGMEKMDQVLLNVCVGRRPLQLDPAIFAAVSHCERRLEGRGRVVVRPSGTESLIRVMVEGEDRNLIQGMAQELVGVIQACPAYV